MLTSPVKNSAGAKPAVLFLTLENAVSTNSSFPLDFTVDRQVSKMFYDLDNRDVVFISGNTTLSGLSNGQHNVIVYATDEFGNKGVSDVLFFNVNAPEFPLVPVIAAFWIAVALASAGLLIYQKKREQKQNANSSKDS